MADQVENDLVKWFDAQVLQAVKDVAMRFEVVGRNNVAPASVATTLLVNAAIALAPTGISENAFGQLAADVMREARKTYAKEIAAIRSQHGETKRG